MISSIVTKLSQFTVQTRHCGSSKVVWIGSVKNKSLESHFQKVSYGHFYLGWPTAWFSRGLASIFDICHLSSETFNFSSIFINCPLFLKISNFTLDKMNSSAEPKKKSVVGNLFYTAAHLFYQKKSVVDQILFIAHQCALVYMLHSTIMHEWPQNCESIVSTPK